MSPAPSSRAWGQWSAAFAVALGTAISFFGHRSLTYPDPLTRYVVAADVLQLGALLWLAFALAVRPTGPRGDAPARRLGQPWLWAGAVLLLAAAVAAARSFAHLTVAAALFAAALTVAGVAAGRALPRSEWGWVWIVAVPAAVARLVAAAALHLYGRHLGGWAVVLDDESAYNLAAQALGALFAHPLASLPWEWRHLVGPHLSLLATLYQAFGPYPLTIRLADAFLGTLAVVVTAGVAGTLGGRSAALAVGLTLGLMPSLALLSATLLRESLVLLLVALGLWAGLRWRRAPSLAALVLLAGVLEALGALRLFAGLALGVAVALSLVLWSVEGLARRAGPWRAWAGVAAGASTVAFVAVVGLLFAPDARAMLWPPYLLYRQVTMELTPPPLELVSRERDIARLAPDVGGPPVYVREAGTGVQIPGMVIAWATSGDVYVATSRHAVVVAKPDEIQAIESIDPGVALRLVLVRAAYGVRLTLLAPLGVGVLKGPYLPFVAEWLLWVASLALATAGAARRWNPYLVLPLSFVVGVLVALSAVPGNAGNLVRQRTVLAVPALLIAGSAPLGELGRRWQTSTGSGRAASTFVARVVARRRGAARAPSARVE